MQESAIFLHRQCIGLLFDIRMVHILPVVLPSAVAKPLLMTSAFLLCADNLNLYSVSGANPSTVKCCSLLPSAESVLS